jgi:hypothetical protein
MKFVPKKRQAFEALTFGELVEFGRNHCGADMVKNMPWHFFYEGYPITHENDECYLIPSADHHGNSVTLKFTPADILYIDAGILRVSRLYQFSLKFTPELDEDGLVHWGAHAHIYRPMFRGDHREERCLICDEPYGKP